MLASIGARLRGDEMPLRKYLTNHHRIALLLISLILVFTFNGAKNKEDLLPLPVITMRARWIAQKAVEAEEMIKQGDFESANILLKRALKALGECQVVPGVFDDTDQGMAVAQADEDDGDLENAAIDRYAALRSRMGSCPQTFP
ncbi:hypothetical protein [Nitrospirillum sp. BR 11163]|uniref:hypothetical protein n=1 Tax=Nitrospirillum sp. BR 11163 TaxID=3104323 RepID=UPI002AFFD2EA|nr:hypothetical protein [Nitrospirillum sp. BR 11163]MEA1676183.1 hypothetical protein [Nitrospirillum sp. BR 11163]